MPEPDVYPVRKLMRRWETPHDVRFLTFSCYRRLPLFAHPATREVFVDVLAASCSRLGFRMFAWVVMPEHVHLLMMPGDAASVAAVLRSIKTSVAKRIIDGWRQTDAAILGAMTTPNGMVRFWQKGGGFDRNVRDREALTGAIRYIHQNPMERGLVERAEDWRWSSVRWWMGERGEEDVCSYPPGDPEAWSRWRGFV